MRTNPFPRTVIIGRFVIHTQNLFIARAVEEQLEREGAADRGCSGFLRLGDECIEWFALPSAVTSDMHFPLSATEAGHAHKPADQDFQDT